MITSLTKGLDEEKKKRVEQEYKASSVYRDQVKEWLTKEREVLVTKMLQADTSSSNWSNEQAMLIAQIKANEKFFKVL